MDMIFALALLLIVAISVVWSVFVRKLAKTRIKSICVIVCVLLALIGTIVLKSIVIDPAFAKDVVIPLIPSLPEEVLELINSSDLLLEFAIGFPVALIAPLLFVVLYIVFSILAGIVYLFIILFAGKSFKNKGSNDVPYAKARSIAWSAGSSLLALLVILIPVAFYGGLAEDVVGIVANVESVDEKTQNTLNDVSENYLSPIADGATIGLFRALGGDLLIDEMTSFNIEGEVVYLKTELDAIVDVATNVVPLTKDGAPGSYDEAEAINLENAVTALTESKFLTAIASEAIYLLTDDMVNGESDMPMADDELLGGLVSKTITILHDDAKETDNFKADLKTVSKMAGEFIRGDVFANTSDTEALMDALAGDDSTTIKKVIIVLADNSSMKCLIPEVTSIGIKAIANAVEVKEDAGEVYDELMSTIAADLNSVKDYDDVTKVQKLSPKLTAAFDKAGIVIDKQVIDLYSVAMIQGIINEKGEEEIVATDIQAFFVAFNDSAENISNPTPAEGDENANSAPAALARLIYGISNLNLDSKNKENYQGEALKTLLATEAQAMLGTTESDLYKVIVEGVEVVVNEENNETKSVGPVTLKRNLDNMFVDEKAVDEYAIQRKFYSTSTFESTKALTDATAMKEKSLLIFMDEIEIDVTGAAAKINDENKEKEADAINNIFSQAGGLMDDLSGEELNLGTMAGTVGAILNDLSYSVSVGEEKTANLFIAIIQSSMVRESAKMDIGTATQLGVKGTVKSGNAPVDYSKTFTTISNTMEVLKNMDSSTEGGMEQADLSVVLKDLNPQTAGMMESYITEERLADDYQLNAEQSATAAPLISDVFGYWNEPGVAENMTPEQSEQEAAALNDVMTLVTGASDRANNGETTGQTVFGDDPDTSVMGKSADDTVKTFMASEALKHSLNKNSEDGTLEEDPFGMSEMMEEDSQDKQDLKDAMKNYYNDPENASDKEKNHKDLNNLGKLFGLTGEDMEYILGENN